MPTFNGTTGNDNMDYRTYAVSPGAGWPENQIWLNLNGLAGNLFLRGCANLRVCLRRQNVSCAGAGSNADAGSDYE